MAHAEPLFLTNLPCIGAGSTSGDTEVNPQGDATVTTFLSQRVLFTDVFDNRMAGA